MQRIEEVRSNLGLNKSSFCERIGYPEANFYNLSRPGAKPSEELLVAVLRHTPTRAEWLMLGTGPRDRDGESAGGEGPRERDRESLAVRESPGPYSPEQLGDGFFLVPLYDVQASAGVGAVVEQERLLSRLAFRSDWILRELKVDPHSLALITASGDSMQPTVGQGDLLLLNIHQQTVTDDAIYALQVHGGLVIKRVQMLLDGTLIIRSDNPLYQEQRVRPDEAPRIVGRVVWIAKRV
jgi:phage repressor protein C with HTH and peptisase S24 domain